MTNALIEIDEAARIVLETAQPLHSEHVELSLALGRVLAQDVLAVEAVPAFEHSAMDGFAVRSSDVRNAGRGSPVRLRVVGESRAGHPADCGVGAGKAIAISTGAMMPEGADAVVRVEQTRSHNGCVEVLSEAPAGRDVRGAGEDIAAGATALERGTRLGAAELGVLASVGCATPLCTRRPRVSILTTGDELVEPGERPGPGMVRNSNAHTIPALAQGVGAEVLAVTSVGDDPDATTTAIAAALDCDVVVICGGVSVGVHDHVKGSLAALGVQQRFWGVALKPGKPTWFGTLGERLVFGLPGNPVSCMVTFMLLVRPALYALSGARERTLRSTATLTRDYEKRPGRAHAVRCRLKPGERGWQAEPTGEQGSHILTSMLRVDALAIIPSTSESLSAGERVEILILDRGWGGCS